MSRARTAGSSASRALPPHSLSLLCLPLPPCAAFSLAYVPTTECPLALPPPCAIRLLYKSFAPTSDPVVGAAQKAAKNERVEKKRKRKEDKSKRKRAAS